MAHCRSDQCGDGKSDRGYKPRCQSFAHSFALTHRKTGQELDASFWLLLPIAPKEHAPASAKEKINARPDHEVFMPDVHAVWTCYEAPHCGSETQKGARRKSAGQLRSAMSKHRSPQFAASL